MYASRKALNEIERQEYMAALQESRDWVLSLHPHLENAPPVALNTQPIPCKTPHTMYEKSINPSHHFGCYSPGDWIGAMWLMSGQSGAQPSPEGATINTTWS